LNLIVSASRWGAEALSKLMGGHRLLRELLENEHEINTRTISIFISGTQTSNRCMPICYADNQTFGYRILNYQLSRTCEASGSDTSEIGLVAGMSADEICE